LGAWPVDEIQDLYLIYLLNWAVNKLPAVCVKSIGFNQLTMDGW